MCLKRSVYKPKFIFQIAMIRNMILKIWLFYTEILIFGTQLSINSAIDFLLFGSI